MTTIIHFWTLTTTMRLPFQIQKIVQKSKQTYFKNCTNTVILF